MKKFFRIIGYGFLTMFAATAVLAFVTVMKYNLNYPHFIQSEFQNCMRGRFVVPAPRDGGLIDIGDIEICGMGMEISPVYGPNMETHIERLTEENARLRAGLYSCQEKQSL